MIGSHGYAVASYLKTIRQFFSSDARSTAIGWFALLLCLLLTVNGLNVVNSYVGRDFMTAISDRRQRQFMTYGVLYAGVFVASSIVAAFYRFSEERLRLLWRAWLTGTLIDRYLSNNTFYRLQANEKVDNPDERITEDVKSYTQTTLAFFLLSLNAVITSAAFLGVLWSITQGWSWRPSRTRRSGRPQRFSRPPARSARQPSAPEGSQPPLSPDPDPRNRRDHRHHGCLPAMRDCLHERLRDVVANNLNIITVTRNLGFFTNSYNYLIQLIPALASRTHVHERGGGVWRRHSVRHGFRPGAGRILA